MEDYKEGYLWGGQTMSLCNSFPGLYFESTYDVISVTMATHKVHKNVHSILVFVNYLKNLFGDLPFLLFCRKVP